MKEWFLVIVWLAGPEPAKIEQLGPTSLETCLTIAGAMRALTNPVVAGCSSGALSLPNEQSGGKDG